MITITALIDISIAVLFCIGLLYYDKHYYQKYLDYVFADARRRMNEEAKFI
jgi:hypothetical protein